MKNLTVKGTVNCDNAAGIVARMNGGTIDNCISYVEINGILKAGGIVCAANSSDCIIKNCINNGDVKAVVDNTRFTEKPRRASVGGIVDYSNTRNVDNCINNGAIGSNNSEFCGGIIGIVLNGNSAIITGCSNGEDVTISSAGTSGKICTLNGNAKLTLNSVETTGSAID